MFRLSLDAGLRVAAVAVMLGEYVGGVVYLVRPLWGLGLCLLPLFHVAVETLGLDIELFSYYMIATHVALLLPDRFIERGGRALGPIWGRALPRARPVPPPQQWRQRRPRLGCAWLRGSGCRMPERR